MADLSDVQSAAPVKIVGSDSNGVETNPVSAPTTTPGLADAALPVRPIPFEPQTYSATASNFVSAATATDVFNIVGSGSKTIRIHKVRVTGSTTSGSAIKLNVMGIKRSAANTGGTRVVATNVAHDSNNAAATANIGHYTANPSGLGAAVGTMRASHVGITQSGLSGGAVEWDFAAAGQPVILRGTSEQFCVNFNSTTVSGALISIIVEWSEV